MAVPAGTARIHTVIEMDGAEPLKTDNAVKFLQHLVQPAGNVVAAVPDMAGVKTDSQFVSLFHAVENLPQFREVPADLAALSRHRLQQHGRGLLFFQHLIQGVRNPRDPGLCPLSHMGTRMKIIIISGNIFHAP